MKKYIKNNQIKPQQRIIVVVDGKQVINPTEEQILSDGWVEYIPQVAEYTLESLKENILKEIERYDKSENVNSFIINGVSAWIDRDTRVSLMNSTTILKNSNIDTTTLWLNNTPYVINCELLIQMLSNLEIYALQCYNITEQHKANIKNLVLEEDLLNYSFKENYPDKLYFTL